MKCEKCKKRVDITFLNKLIGTSMKDKKGKKHYFCNECQKKYTKTELTTK